MLREGGEDLLLGADLPDEMKIMAFLQMQHPIVNKYAALAWTGSEYTLINFGTRYQAFRLSCTMKAWAGVPSGQAQSIFVQMCSDMTIRVDLLYFENQYADSFVPSSWNDSWSFDLALNENDDREYYHLHCISPREFRHSTS